MIFPEIYRMRFLLFCLMILVATVPATAQNLVANKGFEERNTCSEYQVECAPEGWFFLPRYARMSPVESDSNNFELLAMGEPRKDFSVGNFIYTKLLCPLKERVRYKLTFRIRIPGFDFDYLDIWFSTGEPGSRRNSLYGNKQLHTITPDMVFGNKKEWMDVSYTFLARGNERFITIGNFQQKALERARKGSRRKKLVEYWIDDISLVPVENASHVCAEYEAVKDQVYRNNPRHPGHFIESVPMDSSLLPQPPVVIKRPSTDTSGSRVDTPVTTKPVTPQVKTDTLIIPDVLFQFNSSKLNPAFAPRLDSLGRKIVTIRFNNLLIAGHTDNVGSDAYNMQLSADRAATIKRYLVDKFKIDQSMIDTIGYGESLPRASNSTASGRQQNRRVEIIIYYP